MSTLKKFVPILVFVTLFFCSTSYADWTFLGPGLEWGTFTTQKKSPVGDSRISILRIDPKLWEIVLAGVTWTDTGSSMTAREWCEKHGLTAAINAGMFRYDHRTHVGFLRSGKHVNNTNVNKYMSVAGFDPFKEDPPFRIFDLDDPSVSISNILSRYSSVVQNLRLIKKPGVNRWSQQNKMWSEAALGEDRSGNALFIFSRSPFTMHDLNNELLSLEIGLVAAQHLEGGPEAQLYVKIENVEKEMFGSFETDFTENDLNDHAWAIPNVIGIRPNPADLPR